MAPFGSYSFVCRKCQEPLFSAKVNSWRQVGKSHVTANPQVGLEEMNGLVTLTEVLSGTKELFGCQVTDARCNNCDSRVGVKCIEAVHEKKHFIGRHFLKNKALDVHGVNPRPRDLSGYSGTSRLPATNLGLEIDGDPLQASENPASIHSSSHSPSPAPALGHSELKSPPADLPSRSVSANDLRIMLDTHSGAMRAAVKSMDALLNELAVFNAKLNMAAPDRHGDSEARPKNKVLQESIQGRQRDADTNMEGQEPASNTGDPRVPVPPEESLPNSKYKARASSTLSTQQYLEQNVRTDDSDDSDFELSDASIARRRKAAREAAASAKNQNMQGDSGRQRDTPDEGAATSGTESHLGKDEMHLDGQISDTLSDPSIVNQPPRGQSSRRGISGQHTVSIATGVKRKRKSSPAAGSPKDPPHHQQGDGNVTGRIARVRNRRASGYQPSPLVSAISADNSDVSDELAAPIIEPGLIGGYDVFSPQGESAPSANPAVIGGRDHQDIMKLVRKGMSSSFKQSSLMRSYSRVTTADQQN